MFGPPILQLCMFVVVLFTLRCETAGRNEIHCSNVAV